MKIALDFSTKFNRSITAQCVTKTIAKKAEILRTIQAMAQTNNLNLRNRDSHICSKTYPLGLMKPVGYYLDSLKLRLFFDIFAKQFLSNKHIRQYIYSPGCDLKNWNSRTHLTNCDSFSGLYSVAVWQSLLYVYL